MASRTQNFGIKSSSLNANTPDTVVYVGALNRLNNAATLSATLGGTGIDSSASTGVAKIAAGIWSVDYIKAQDFGEPFTNGYVLSAMTGGSVQWISNETQETVTQVTSSPYTVVAGDKNLAVQTSLGPFTINLPGITSTRRIGIIDVDGFCGSNNITIVPSIGDTIIRSVNSLTLLYPNISIDLLSVSATNWHVVSKN